MTWSSLVDDVLSHKKGPEDIYRSAGSNFTYRPICFSLWRAVDNGPVDCHRDTRLHITAVVAFCIQTCCFHLGFHSPWFRPIKLVDEEERQGAIHLFPSLDNRVTHAQLSFVCFVFLSFLSDFAETTKCVRSSLGSNLKPSRSPAPPSVRLLDDWRRGRCCTRT